MTNKKKITKKQKKKLKLIKIVEYKKSDILYPLLFMSAAILFVGNMISLVEQDITVLNMFSTLSVGFLIGAGLIELLNYMISDRTYKEI